MIMGKIEIDETMQVKTQKGEISWKKTAENLALKLQTIKEDEKQAKIKNRENEIKNQKERRFTQKWNEKLRKGEDILLFADKYPEKKPEFCKLVLEMKDWKSSDYLISELKNNNVFKKCDDKEREMYDVANDVISAFESTISEGDYFHEEAEEGFTHIRKIIPKEIYEELHKELEEKKND